MPECQHQWIPLIRMNDDGRAPCGSLGSQTGYRCRFCGAEDIRWPRMAAQSGVTEETLMRLNAAMRLAASNGAGSAKK